MGNEQHRIVFMGTPEFAIHSLQILLEHNFNIVGVITAPDKPAGRGKKLKLSPVKKFAVQNDLKILQPSNLKDPEFQAELKILKAELFIVVAFRMLPKSVWSLPPRGTINLHASLLPQYRGAAPINWVLINGEKETGLTTFFIEEKIDTGDIIDQVKIELNQEITAGELHDIMKVKGAHLLLNTVKNIFNRDVVPKKQSIFSEIKPAPKINREDCEIDWTQDKNDIYNKVRGLSPYPGSFTYIIDEAGNTKILKIILVDCTEKPNEKFEPGSVLTDGKSFINIAAKDGFISLKEIQLEGKRKMNVRDLLNGTAINNNWKCIT